MTVVILTPVLARPHRVQPLLDSIRAATPDARVLFICDPDDTEERAAVAAAGGEELVVAGNYARKINQGVRATDEPLVFLGADDLHFHPGWLQRAVAYLTDDVQVVGVNDLCSQRVRDGVHATHFLMTREYAERPTIDGRRGPLHEAYDHSCVDDELVATALHRRTLAFATDAIVEHLHPDAGRGEWDTTYAKGRARIGHDRRRFRSRMRLWR